MLYWYQNCAGGYTVWHIQNEAENALMNWTKTMTHLKSFKDVEDYAICYGFLDLKEREL